MPTVRDGRGKLTEYRVDPVGSPPGPVERAQVSAARMADFAAERVPRNGASARPSRDDAREARIVAVLEAVRTTPSLTAAGAKVGVSNQRVGQIIHQLRRDGQLPADVDELLRARGRHGERPIRQPAWVDETLQDTPPFEDPPAAGIAPEYSAPIVTEATEASPEGEDRCAFGRWLGQTHLTVCDRQKDHAGEHRGRLFQVGVTAQTCALFGHLAVPA